MMVRIKDGVVREIIPDYAQPVEKWYGPDFALQCVEAPAEVRPGWLYDGNVFTEPQPRQEAASSGTLEERVAALEAAIQSGLTLYEEDLGDG